MRSLQSRLSIGLTISIVILLLAQWLAVSFTIRHVAEDFVALRLQHDAEDLLPTLQFTEDSISVNAQRISSVYSAPFSGHYYRIQSPTHTLRSRSLWDEDIETSPLSPGEINEFHVTGPQQQPLLVWQGGYKKRGQQITISVAEDIFHIEEDITQFMFWYSSATLLAVILFILTQLTILRRSLRPLEQVRQEITLLEKGETRSLSETVPSEVRPLVSEFNQLLTVMAQRLKRSRNATGNLAHALKTPLALMMQLIERDELTAIPQLQQELRQSILRIQQLMERELRHAQLAGKAPSGQQFNFEEELPPLIDTLQRIYQEKNITINTTITGNIQYAADREDLLELLGNLLDNACKWAEHKVALSISYAHNLQIMIEDDGPGCSAEAMQQLTQRGTRIDEHSEKNVDGHGLGLAIVHDIVTAYDGVLTFKRSTMGGLAVAVTMA